MPLAPGFRIGVYEITAALGAGGMGEVYRARDTRLGRDVAVKILPDNFATDPDRLARFEREARTLAQLNHPHIAHVHGFEQAGGVHALVLEFVGGEDLSARIARGALPLDDAIAIARQIADALAAAHDAGIVHRDLKPANIRIGDDGTVKVLDFGLAKIVEAGAGQTVDQSPTITAPGITAAGIVLGTAAYMSPEQARGRPVDKRADIWAFGCVLYEMLAGRPAFHGETASDVLAAILEREPDLAGLRADTPLTTRRLIGRCLHKDVRRRWRDIGDVRVELDEPIAGGPDAPTPAGDLTGRRLRTVAVASAALIVGAATAGAAIWALMPRASPAQPPMRFEIASPAAPLVIEAFNRNLALSPDGTYIVYVSSGGQLMIRALDRLDSVPIAGVTGANSPFVSPDGRWIGFFTGVAGELKKVSVAGGPPLLLCRYHGNSGGASWGPDDTIVFATNDPSTGLMRVAATGGDATVLTTPDRARGESDHLFPSVLPSGRAVLFTTTHAARGAPQIDTLDIDTGRRRTLIHGASAAEYVGTGSVAYIEGGALRTVRFDAAGSDIAGDPTTVVDRVMTTLGGAAEFSVSRSGTLVYVPGGSATGARSLAWFDRNGHDEPIEAPERSYVYPRISPDGTRAALDIRDLENDIWIWDFVRKTLTRLTIDAAIDQYPVWTPDSRRVIFASTRAGAPNLFWQLADNTGVAERLTSSPNNQYPTSISPNGRQLVFRENTPSADAHLHTVILRSESGETTASAQQTQSLIQTANREDNGELSPDGRFLAYQAADAGSGRYEIYVRPFPNVGAGLWQISSRGGTKPVWARNGQELFYLDADDALTVVSVETTSGLRTGAPTRLFSGSYYAAAAGRTYDISPDGKNFLMVKSTDASSTPAAPPSMVVVLNRIGDSNTRDTK